jgi:hypothetical protein
MRLDYSVPNFEFLVGGFDCTNYLDEISLSLPIYEIAQMLTWSGRFKLSYNRKAISAGLPVSAFTPDGQPGRWRPAQVPVTLKIRGYTLPVMRIDRYAFNLQNGIGEGTLTQILDVVATDRPAQLLAGRTTGGSAPNLVATTGNVANVVRKLIDQAFKDCTVATPVISTGEQIGVLYGLAYSSNPISDAQRLVGTQWQWLTVDNTEAVRTISGNPLPLPVLFNRSLGQVEWEPDIDHVNFAAEKVIVTGSRQQLAKIPCQESPEPLNPNLDKKGRPLVQRTEERQPFNQVFARNNGGITDLTLAEIKWIFYQYKEENNQPSNWDSQLWRFIPAELLFELQTDLPLPDAALGSVCQTVTVTEWPGGRVFSKLGTNTSLMTAVLEFQSEKRKARYVPFGVLNPKAGTVTTLSAERIERLKTKPYFPSGTHGGTVNPKTGQPQCLEPVPAKEERQPLAEQPLETVPVRGIATVAPAGWTPITPRDLVMEMGYLPSDGAAKYLAEQIAKRESWRRDSLKIIMPIPEEWLVAGCPPLRRCYLHDGHWQMDGLILSIQGQEAKFAFTAARIDRLGASVVSLVETLDTGFAVEASCSLVAPEFLSAGLVYEAEISLLADTVAGFRIEVDIGLFTILPTTEIIAPIYFGSNIELQPTLAIEAPVVISAEITLVSLPNITLTVIPSSVPEGTIILPNITLTVSPSNAAEGT